MQEPAYLATHGAKWKEKVIIEGGEIKKKTSSNYRNRRHTRNPAQWWDEECERVLKTRQKKFKEWKKMRNVKSFIEYNKAKAIARKTIKQKKGRFQEVFYKPE